jgi:hypothetical protein
MSWLYSQALVEEYLGENFSDGEQFAPLSGSPIQQAYCAPDKMTAFSRLSRFGMTYKPLTESLGEELLTLYREDFHAKTLAQQEKAQELTGNEAECGKKWRASFTKYDPSLSLWKTHQCSLLGDLDEFLETWPQWGLMRDGECWEQRTLEQTIRGTESGLSEQIWPTPRSCSAMAATITPEAAWNKKRNPNLETIVGRVQFPTPTCHNSKEGAYPSEFNRKTPTLATHAGGKLNPDWVEWLMNWPIKWSDLNGFNKQEFQRWQEASAKAVQGVGQMRTMWWDADPSQTPYGQQSIEQPKQQHSDSLPKMSWNASCERTMERSQQGSDLSLLRSDVHLQEAKRKDLQSGMWQQTCMDETQIISRVGGTGIATANRLKAIGNGQVPLCAATAWRILSE